MLKRLHRAHPLRNSPRVELHLRLLINKDVAPTSLRFERLHVLPQFAIRVEEITTDEVVAARATAPTGAAAHGHTLGPPRAPHTATGAPALVRYRITASSSAPNAAKSP